MEYKLLETFQSGKFTFKKYLSPGIVFHTVEVYQDDTILMVTPPRPTLTLQTTSHMLERQRAHVAINGGGFIQSAKGIVRLLGPAASQGRWYSKKQFLTEEQTLYIDRYNDFTLTKPRNLWNAISFPNLLIHQSIIVAPANRGDIAPRTILGISYPKSTIWILVIDGFESFRTGATLFAAASLLKSLEPTISLAINMDGGGSTTLAMRANITDHDFRATLINTPSDDNVAGRERPVANHLLFY